MNAVTGTVLLIADATTKLTNPDFYLKMVFIVIGVVVLNVMRTRIFADPDLDSAPVHGSRQGPGVALTGRLDGCHHRRPFVGLSRTSVGRHQGPDQQVILLGGQSWRRAGVWAGLS